MYDVEIADRPARRVVGLPHRGAYSQIGPTFGRLADALTAGDLWPEAIEFLGVYQDDPRTVPEADLRSLAGIAVREDLALPGGFEQARLPAGRHAVLHHVGPYDGLPAAWARLNATWLPQSGQSPGGGAACEIYVDSPQDVPAERLRTDICLPLV